MITLEMVRIIFLPMGLDIQILLHFFPGLMLSLKWNFKGSLCLPDFIPPMDTRASGLSGAGGSGSCSFNALGMPSPNPLGGSLGSVPDFVGDKHSRAHKKRKIFWKAKHAKKSDDA